MVGDIVFEVAMLNNTVDLGFGTESESCAAGISRTA